ncbi:MAG TPA: DNA-binding response regulator [Thermodesulfovibrionales bacterium]|nr:DNA-binding response regulator [Thermodesulfovibrionales bacterium]
MMREILVMDCEERGAFWLTLKSDFVIAFVTTGEEGLEKLSENIGLVFLTLTLQDMSSMEVLDEIKRKYPSTAVVIIAPCGTEEPCLCMEAFRRGAWDYIRKPLKAEEILRKIRVFMNGDNDPQHQRHESLSTETAMQEQYPDIPLHIVKGVLKVRDFVAQNYSESLTLEAACKMAATSKTYFCRFFKCITGYSLRSYQNLVRVQVAEHLLRDRQLSVSDVAGRLGYNDSNYFSTIYKRVTGVSPTHRQMPIQSPCMLGRTRQDIGKSPEHIVHERFTNAYT